MGILCVDPERPDPAVIAEAARVLRDGGLVAFPTETVYGLGADALSAAAVRRIFEAKGRPFHNPLIVHVADGGSARRLVRDWPDRADRIASAFWPGPVTLVLPRSAAVPDAVSAGLDTVAVRSPAHPVALALLREAGVPVAAPSANRSTEISPTLAAHVEKGLGAAVDLILDAGPTAVGIESVVLDLSGPEPELLRPGTVTVAELERVLGVTVRLPDPGGDAAGTPRSPGRLERHYAPRAEVLLFEGRERAAAETRARREAEAGRRVGGILFELLDAPLHRREPMPADPAAYARAFYAALHALDDAGCNLILIEDVPDGPEWAAVRDRLTRAAW